jgi:formyl-CoA transferase
MYPHATFKTRDGVMTLACGNENMWRRLRDALGLQAFENDDRFVDNAARMKNRAELRGIIEGVLAAKNTDDWLVIVGKSGVPCGPVLTVGQALHHPVTAGLEMVARTEHATLGSLNLLGQSVSISGSEKNWLRRPPPLLGQHTREVLAEAGYDDARIDALLAGDRAMQCAPRHLAAPDG